MKPLSRQDRIVAVGLLTERDLEILGSSFSRAYPIDQAPCFEDLLAAIDDADRQMRRDPQGQDKPG